MEGGEGEKGEKGGRKEGIQVFGERGEGVSVRDTLNTDLQAQARGLEWSVFQRTHSSLKFPSSPLSFCAPFYSPPSTWNRAAELWGYIEVEVCYMQLQVEHQCNVDDPYTAQAAVTISWRKSNHFDI